MPFFAAVGHIDDAVFTTEEAVKREYRRRYSLAAYHRRRDAIVRQVSPQNTCELCPAIFRRVVPITLVWRSKEAELQGKTLGVKRANYLATTNKKTCDEVLRRSLVQALCMHHAKMKLWRKGAMTHGTYWSSYRHKCQCDECEEYRADYVLRRRENRRGSS